MIELVACLGSLGLIALLPMTELVRRALLGRRFEESFDEYRSSIPFDLPDEVMPSTSSEGTPLRLVVHTKEQVMGRDVSLCHPPAAESGTRPEGGSLDRKLPA
jgi:hypothetical protein